MIDPIAPAIPVFLLLIGVEVLVLRAQGRLSWAYRFNDAIAAMSCGIGQQVTGVFIRVALIPAYIWVYAHAPFHLSGAIAWIVGFFAVDVMYYWWHRWTHVVNVGWASHVVHHQSETYNLAIALRQSLTSSLTGAPFHWVCALIGVPPLVFFTHDALNTLYQFWIHTESIRKMPAPFEAIFNTPSHHRVHHAVNPRYLDKNYAGVLIVWDRLFGTFEPESERAVYGTVKEARTFDPLWANVQWLAVVARDAAAGAGLDRLKVWWGHPGWRPAGLPAFPDPETALRTRGAPFDPPKPAWAVPYVAAWFLPVVGLVIAALLLEDTGRWSVLAAISASCLAAGSCWGALFEGKRWWAAAEVARLSAFAPVVWAASGSVALTGVAAALAVGSLAFVVSRRVEVLPLRALT